LLRGRGRDFGMRVVPINLIHREPTAKKTFDKLEQAAKTMTKRVEQAAAGAEEQAKLDQKIRRLLGKTTTRVDVKDVVSKIVAVEDLTELIQQHPPKSPELINSLSELLQTAQWAATFIDYGDTPDTAIQNIQDDFRGEIKKREDLEAQLAAEIQQRTASELVVGDLREDLADREQRITDLAADNRDLTNKNVRLGQGIAPFRCR